MRSRPELILRHNSIAPHRATPSSPLSRRFARPLSLPPTPTRPSFQNISEADTSVVPLGVVGIYMTVFPTAAKGCAKPYWQHAGEGARSVPTHSPKPNPNPTQTQPKPNPNPTGQSALTAHCEAATQAERNPDPKTSHLSPPTFSPHSSSRHCEAAINAILANDGDGGGMAPDIHPTNEFVNGERACSAPGCHVAHENKPEAKRVLTDLRQRIAGLTNESVDNVYLAASVD